LAAALDVAVAVAKLLLARWKSRYVYRNYGFESYMQGICHVSLVVWGLTPYI